VIFEPLQIQPKKTKTETERPLRTREREWDGARLGSLTARHLYRRFQVISQGAPEQSGIQIGPKA